MKYEDTILLGVMYLVGIVLGWVGHMLWIQY
jgi:hypothetical protein